VASKSSKSIPAKKKPAKKASNKTQPTAVSVADFIAAVPNETRRKDAKALVALFKKVSGEKPVMWGPSIIGFGRRSYRYDSGREGEIMLAGFSPRGANLVLYLHKDFPGADALIKRLGKHKTSMACLYVNTLADVDMAVLEELIARAWAHAPSVEIRDTRERKKG
jgi:hypothetical protein